MTYEVGFWTTVFVGFCSFIACLICAKFFAPNLDESSETSKKNFVLFFFIPIALPILYIICLLVAISGCRLREIVSLILVFVSTLLMVGIVGRKR